MNILLAYATNSGSTYTASNIVKEELTNKGHQVTLKKIETIDSQEFAQFDLVIFASPTWLYEKKDGMPHDLFVKFMTTHQDKTFPGRKFAILGLGDSSYMRFCGVVDHLEEYVQKIQGELAYPSLRIDAYYFNEKNVDRIRQWSRQI